MAFQSLIHQVHIPKLKLRGFKQSLRSLTALAGATAIAITTLSGAGLAADPFRTVNPHDIDDNTEAAFRAIFEDGDYLAAQTALEDADEDEPMARAMWAALAYLDEDWDALEAEATATREAAEQLMETDPLRGHIYTAVGHFLEGTHAFVTQGTVRGTPVALSKLQRVFNNLDQAEQLAPDDPELNLLRGYMDLMLAVNLPFSDPNDAIARLENYAAPDYLAQRGIAIGYRDLNQGEAAMNAVDQAIAAAPNNPELLYLKAQIFVKQNRYPESLAFFSQAVEKAEQLPQEVAEQIAWEYCRAQNNVDGQARNCSEVRD
jgi:tetratricopeptide (TPR) repeat protein